jgi:hypothetical protein
VEQLVDDLAIEELEQSLAPLDHGDRHAQRREDRGVLDADHTGAHHGERPRQLGEPDEVVGREDHLPVGCDTGERCGFSADGNHDIRGGDVASVLLAADRESMRIREARFSRQHGDVIPAQLALDDLDLARDDAVEAGEKIRAGRAPIEPRPRQAISPAGDPGVRDHRLAQRLARDGAGGDAHAAERSPLLHDRCPLAELGRLDGSALPRWAASNRHEIEVVGRSHSLDIARPPLQRPPTAFGARHGCDADGAGRMLRRYPADMKFS